MGRKYKNPPIIEAVCEFRFEPGGNWDLAVPGLMFEKLKDDFPDRQPRVTFEAALTPSPKGVQQRFTRIEYLQFLRNDKTMLVEVGQHRLGVSHFKPYSNWETFLPVIRRALEVYRDVVQPKAYGRIGLRYVNQIEIPGTTLELEDHFNFYPFIGAQLPQDFSSFMVGVEIPQHEGRDILRLQMTTGARGTPEVVLIRLDLDCFVGKAGEVPLDGETDWLNTAHERVEAAFEGCIKDSLRERFGEVRG